MNNNESKRRHWRNEKRLAKEEASIKRFKEYLELQKESQLKLSEQYKKLKTEKEESSVELSLFLTQKETEQLGQNLADICKVRPETTSNEIARASLQAFSNLPIKERMALIESLEISKEKVKDIEKEIDSLEFGHFELIEQDEVSNIIY